MWCLVLRAVGGIAKFAPPRMKHLHSTSPLARTAMISQSRSLQIYILIGLNGCQRADPVSPKCSGLELQLSDAACMARA